MDEYVVLRTGDRILPCGDAGLMRSNGGYGESRNNLWCLWGIADRGGWGTEKSRPSRETDPSLRRIPPYRHLTVTELNISRLATRSGLVNTSR